MKLFSSTAKGACLAVLFKCVCVFLQICSLVTMSSTPGGLGIHKAALYKASLLRGPLADFLKTATLLSQLHEIGFGIVFVDMISGGFNICAVAAVGSIYKHIAGASNAQWIGGSVGSIEGWKALLCWPLTGCALRQPSLESIDHWPGFSWAITKIWLMVCLFVRGKIVPKRNIQQTQQKDRSSLEQADCWKSVCLTCGMCPIAVWFFGRRWRLWIYYCLITFTYFILPFVRLLVFFIA